jgi:hypothetical protein
VSTTDVVVGGSGDITAKGTLTGYLGINVGPPNDVWQQIDQYHQVRCTQLFLPAKQSGPVIDSEAVFRGTAVDVGGGQFGGTITCSVLNTYTFSASALSADSLAVNGAGNFKSVQVNGFDSIGADRSLRGSALYINSQAMIQVANGVPQVVGQITSGWPAATGVLSITASDFGTAVSVNGKPCITGNGIWKGPGGVQVEDVVFGSTFGISDIDWGWPQTRPPHGPGLGDKTSVNVQLMGPGSTLVTLTICGGIIIKVS